MRHLSLVRHAMVIAFDTLLLLAAPAAFAQTPRIPFSGGFSGGPDGIKGDATFNLNRSIQVMTNAPYSGEEKVDSVQTLADGTHVTRTIPARTAKVWRDSQGRIRIEQSLGGGGAPYANYKIPTLVQIEDPLAGYIYVMDEMNKVAHRVKAQGTQQHNMEPMMRRADGRGSPTGATATQQRPNTPTQEDLGTQMIDGVSVHGTRMTTVVPTGAQGNDGPITITRDTWYSPDLNLIVRTVSNDPRSGTQTVGIANLTRDNPDPNLFMVPADYQIVDENGTFTIKWDTSSSKK